MKIENRKKLGDVLKEYKEKNTDNKYKPVAVGRYGIRKREEIYSKELAKDYSKNKLIYKNTLTVGMGSKQIDIGILTEDAIYAVSPAYHTFRINNIDANYLRYCLDARNADMSERFMIASARQGKSVDFKKMLRYEIPVYSESDTQTILFNLSKIEEVILNLDSQLEKMDLLVKSRFIEMFGDSNKTCKLGEVCTKITDGTHKTPNYLAEGITFISAKNIVNGELDYSDVKHISEEEYSEIQKRCGTEKYDILLSKSGSLGQPAIIKTDEKLGLFESLAVIKYDRNKLIPEFLKEQLKSDHVQWQFSMSEKGVAVKHLHLEVIKNIDIVLPDIGLQKEFASFVDQIDKSKLAVQQVRKILEKDYRCYWEGELLHEIQLFIFKRK